MSDLPFDPSGQGGGDQPSEEEIREYLGQLRAAPVEQVVAEVASAVLNAAQVKLGRQDGRVLIDVLGAVTDQVRGRLPSSLTDQLDQALTQLRMAQVDAERQVQQAAAQGHSEEGDLPADGEPAAEAAAGEGGTEPSAPQAPPASQQPSSRPGSDPSSRLWVPGR